MANRAPVVTTRNVSIGTSKPTAASSMISSVLDQDRDTITQYAFFDSGAGGGHFLLNGILQAAGQWIVVNAAGLAALSYVGGGVAASETLYVAASDGKAWSTVASLTAVTTAAAPAVSAPRLLSHAQTDPTEATNLRLTFDVAVKGGAGFVSIYQSDNGAVIERIPVASSAISYSADRKTVTIDPRLLLQQDKSYFVQIDNGAFVDSATGTKRYAGLNDHSFAFTTNHTAVNALAAGSLLVTGASLAERIANIALFNQGQLWGDHDCTDFVWAVTNLAGARFFDAYDHTVDGSPYKVQDYNKSSGMYGEVVPHSGMTDSSWNDGWEPVRVPAQFGSTLEPGELTQLLRVGDVVRAYADRAEKDGHEFIVTGRSVNQDGSISIRITDNLDGIRGNPNSNAIATHDLYANGADPYLHISSEVFISRLSGNWTLEGTKAGNTLVGGNGADRLAGGLGNDTLIGGAGADHFVFNTVLNRATNVDTTVDFNRAQGDKIDLDRAVFSGLKPVPFGSSVAAGDFYASVNGAAHLPGDRLLYNSTTGALSYDPDGSGAAVAIQFATLQNHPTLMASDILLV